MANKKENTFWGGGVVVNDELLSHLHAPYRAYALLSERRAGVMEP
jgi:hypothetical protein